MLALLKLLFAILLLLNVAVFVLFIFWPADRVKQIQETLAHVNITEKYFSGEESKKSQSLKSKIEIKENKNWKERSPKDLKVYLSERGVELTEINSEDYLGEILGSKSTNPSSGINLLRPEGRDLSAGELLSTDIIANPSKHILIPERQSKEKLPKVSGNNLDQLLMTGNSDITSIAPLDLEVVTKAEELTNLTSPIIESTNLTNSSSVINVKQSSVNFSSKQSNLMNIQLKTDQIKNNIYSADSLIASSESKIITADLSSKVFQKTQTQSIENKLNKELNKTIHVSGNNKIYELNALIYNPLELAQPESIFVECCDNNTMKVYLPSNIIENTDGTYLSQDHLELWLDRASIKPRTGYGEISHQFGIGLQKNPWVIDFLQNDSDWELTITVLQKGDILVLSIQNLPPDLRAWNIVFSKAVKEGKNWVQGQLISAVEKFTWGNPDSLIPFNNGLTKNATQ
ncbi:MAG: hypothetical protein VX619_02605 [bacterium]|nr:hypothetical protein [bacterium]